MNLADDAYRIFVGTKQNRGRIIPVFLPFAGCPFPCIYCVQDKQSGAGQISIPLALQGLESEVERFVEKNLRLSKTFAKFEIAFYGGTFTALQEEELSLCLDAFIKIKNRMSLLGIKVFGRCSTRPDCLGMESSSNKSSSNTVLSRLKDAGIDLIELGIQSFDDKALMGIGRGYTSNTAKAACQFVKDNGFELGIQLMPAVPNQSVETFHEDVEVALGFKPSCMRFYPCLVPSGTGLAKLWQAGKFIPWDLDRCVDALGYALYRAWQEEIPIIRLSVAPEASFDKEILAGVRHPALGSLIQAKALLYAFQFGKANMESTDSHACKLNTLEFHVPKNFQGFIFGDKKSLQKTWENLVGKRNIFFDADSFEMNQNCKKSTTQYAFFVKRKIKYVSKSLIL